jgi:hypothetical protein
MADIYVEPNGGLGWNPATQDGTTSGAAWKGTVGFAKALATNAAGDRILIKGGPIATPEVLDMQYWWVASTTANHAGTWAVGDTVRNQTGAGDDWTGIIYTISDKIINISLSTGTYAAVNTADRIENVTRAENDTFTKVNTNRYTVTVPGSAAAGFIRYIGCDSSYNPNLGWVKILQSGGLYGINGNGTGTYIGIENIIFDGNALANSRCLYNFETYTRVLNCVFQNQKDWAIEFLTANYFEIIGNVFYPNGNATYPTVNLGGYSKIYRNVFANASGIALACNTQCDIVGNLFYNSTKNHISLGTGTVTRIIGNTFDTTGATYSAILHTTGIFNLFEWNRITNSGGYGIESTGAATRDSENWNYFQNNSSGNLLNIPAGLNSVAGIDTNCGYADANYATTRDYRLAANATLRRQLVNLDFDLATPLHKAYLTAGMIPSDNRNIFGNFVTE